MSKPISSKQAGSVLVLLGVLIVSSSALSASLLNFGSRAAETIKQLEQSEVSMHSAASENPPMGIYLTASTLSNQERRLEYFKSVQEMGGNAVVIDVKGSYVYFEESTSQLADELGLHRPLYNLKDVVDEAHSYGLYVIARYISVKDPVLSSQNPEFQMRHPVSGRSSNSVWIDPSHPTVLEYNRQVMRDVVASGVDEVNLDYIRYPTEFSQASIGLSGNEKADRVIQFVQMARDVIDEYAPQVKLGLSTYAILGWNYPVNLEPLGQDFVRFAPLVDVISPMAYPATFSVGSYYNPAVHQGSRMYSLVKRTLIGYQELLGPDHAYKLRPWIQGYFITSKNVADQIKAVADAGVCGYQFWNANNNYQSVLPQFAPGPVVTGCTSQGIYQEPTEAYYEIDALQLETGSGTTTRRSGRSR